MFDLESWRETIHVRETVDVNVSLSLPSGLEARCYQLNRLEQEPQPAIATKLGISQSSVSRYVKRAEEKIEALKQSKRFDGDEIDRILRKLTNTAPVAA